MAHAEILPSPCARRPTVDAHRRERRSGSARGPRGAASSPCAPGLTYARAPGLAGRGAR